MAQIPDSFLHAGIVDAVAHCSSFNGKCVKIVFKCGTAKIIIKKSSEFTFFKIIQARLTSTRHLVVHDHSTTEE